MLRCEVGERAAAVRNERRPVAAAARRQHGGSPLWPATRCLYLSPPLAVWALIVAVPLSLSSLLRRYYARMTMDFQTNKRVCEEVALIPSKALKNKIAGYATHLMKRIQRGPVRGISLKLQEEERERRMDFVPDVSAVDTDIIDVSARSEERTRAGAARTLGGGADAKGRQGDNTEAAETHMRSATAAPLLCAVPSSLSRAPALLRPRLLLLLLVSLLTPAPRFPLSARRSIRRPRPCFARSTWPRCLASWCSRRPARAGSRRAATAARAAAGAKGTVCGRSGRRAARKAFPIRTMPVSCFRVRLSVMCGPRGAPGRATRPLGNGRR